MFLLVNFNAELISSPLPSPATDAATATHPENVKDANHNNVSVLEAEAEPLAHLASFVANFLSEKVGAGTGTGAGATKSFANLCVITLPPPVPAPEQHSPSLSPRQRQKEKLSNEDEDKSGLELDYIRLGEDLLVAAGLGSAAFFEELRMPLTIPPPPPSGSGKIADYEWGFNAENEGAGAGDTETDDPAGKWKDRGTVVIIPPLDPVLSMFMAHALMHILHEGLMWSHIYIMTDPFSTPPKIVQWD